MGKGTIFNVLSTGFTPHIGCGQLKPVKVGAGKGWTGISGQSQAVDVPRRGLGPLTSQK